MVKIAKVIILFIFITQPLFLFSQSKQISGVVVDSLTNNPVPYVAIYLNGSKNGVLADENGIFKFNYDAGYDTITTSVMGYASKSFVFCAFFFIISIAFFDLSTKKARSAPRLNASSPI